MRTIIPGNVSPAYLKALRETQVKFYQSFTMDEEKAKWVRDNYRDPTLPPKRDNGSNTPKHQGLN